LVFREAGAPLAAGTELLDTGAVLLATGAALLNTEAAALVIGMNGMLLDTSVSVTEMVKGVVGSGTTSAHAPTAPAVAPPAKVQLSIPTKVCDSSST
jgi:hypothetical protein